MQDGQTPAAAALPERWSMALPAATKVPRPEADGESLLQAILQSWDSPILQKAAFCLLDGSKDDGSLDGWRPRESLGTLLHWGVDGLCRGGNRATQQLPPLFLLPGSLVPSSPQLPRGVLRVWLSASHLLP